MLYGGMLGAVFALRVAQSDYYAEESKVVGQQSALARARQIQAGWKKLQYAELAESATHSACLASAESSAPELSAIQKETLRERVSQVLRYLENPEFADYYRMRTDGFDNAFAPNPLVTNLVPRATFNLSAFGNSAGPELALKALWDSVHGTNAPVPRLKAICVESFAGAISRTNSGRALLNGKVGKGMTVAVESVNPGFRYEGDSEPDGRALLFEFSFFAKTISPERAGPVHVSLLWIERDQNWALNRLIADQSLKFQTLF